MRYTLQDFKKYIPDLSWSTGELSDRLSTIGFEAEVVDGDKIDVTLTSNRKDCQDLKYLAFDLAGVYNLKTVENLISFGRAPEIPVTAADVNRLLGSAIGFEQMQELTRLGFIVNDSTVTPPDFRDVNTKADVAEEIVRLIGFDKLAIKPLSKEKAPESTEFNHLQTVKIALSAAGLTETATSSFSSHGHVKLKNPFTEDEPFLRESLLDGLLKTLGRNPFLKRAAFFEIGSVFMPEEGSVVGMVIAGYKNSGELQQQIEKAVGAALTFETVDPAKCQKFDAKQGRIMWTQLPLKDVKPAKAITPASFKKKLPKFQPISKFPPLVRDITIAKTQQNAVDAFKQTAGSLLLAELVDQYRDNQTYRLIFQKMNGSFSEADIRDIDSQIQKHFFKVQ
ncbi:MAG TPA: hypothetical protein VLE93_01625 [Candidatus Saccharimonadales bacterium]|nr:hypothetical protein [Candidatus Saccharimonadales bacterium]